MSYRNLVLRFFIKFKFEDSFLFKQKFVSFQGHVFSVNPAQKSAFVITLLRIEILINWRCHLIIFKNLLAFKIDIVRILRR